MTQILLNIVPTVIGTASGVASAPTSNADGTPAGIDPFRTTLIAQIVAARTSTTGPGTAAPQPAAVPGLDTAVADRTALMAKIKKMLAAGASETQIVSALAEQLAATTAARLHLSGADARDKLKAVFATALAPPGAGGSAATRARDLAQRYVDLERMASAIAERQDGQQNRNTGNVSDAGKAKDNPALPTATRDSRTTQTLGSATPDLAELAARTAALGLTTAANPAQPADRGAAAAAQPAAIPAPAIGAAVAPASSGTAAIPAFGAAAPAPAGAPGVTASAGAPSVTASAGAPSVTASAGAPGTAASAGAPGVTASAGAVDTSATTASSASASSALGSHDAGAGSDGRTVNLNALEAIATGGDSGLGRILTRAAVAADARRPTPPPAPRTAAATASADDVAPAHAEPAAATTPKVEAFVKAFAAALAAATPAVAHADPPPAATVPVAHTADAAPSAFPAVVPAVVERTDAPVPAPPAPAAAPPPIDHSAIADQVLRGAFMRNVGQSSEMRLSLVPESLGDVNVKLIVNDGTVTAHVLAQTADVRDALVAAQPQLTKSLADAGLKLSSFTVGLADSGFAGFSQQQNGRPAPDWRPPATVAAGSLDGETDDAGLAAIPSFGPSVAGLNDGDYNYLA